MSEKEVLRVGLMDRLRQVFNRTQLEPNQPGYVNIWGLSTSGTTVTVDEVLKIPAVLACVRAISETVGMLPYKMFHEFNGKFRPAFERREMGLLADSPNDYQTADQFRQILTADYLLRGDSFAEKELAMDGSLYA